MRTEFLMLNTVQRDEANRQLSSHNYDVTSISNYKGPIVAVEHTEVELSHIKTIVRAVEHPSLTDPDLMT